MSDIHPIRETSERGEPVASGQLLPLVYEELRRLAARKMAGEAPGQTLDATALVHEAYLRLAAGEAGRGWDGRSHFLAAAAEAMRRILVENARRKAARKHGGGRRRRALDEADLVAPAVDCDILDLDEALRKFESRDPSRAEVVKLRYFSGLSLPEVAAVLGISTATAERHWAYARAWLRVEIEGGSGDPAGP